jgi:hypothetical protein
MSGTTIQDIIDRLDQIILSAEKEDDPLGIFAQLYQQVTRQVAAGIQAGYFEEGARMERLDVIFANRFLDAFDHYRAGGEVTKSWRTAFEAARKKDLLILQHLLMGMNAHINLDLGIAAAETVAKPGDLAHLEKDFFLISQMLCDQIEAVQDALGKVSPLLKLLDWFGKKSDEHFAEFSLKQARSHAWSVANKLAALPTQNRTREIVSLDGYVAVLNKLITNPGVFVGGLVRFIKWFEEKNTGKIIAALR